MSAEPGINAHEADGPDGGSRGVARVVRRVDHVPVYVSDPRVLFGVLTERLGLPVGTPVARLAGFESGLVVFGDVFLEVIRPAPGRRVGVALDRGVFGVALEPERLDLAVAELDRRSIPHALPFPDSQTPPPGGAFAFDSEAVPPWTPVMLGGLLGDHVLAKQRSGRLMRSPVAQLSNRVVVRLYRHQRIADAAFALLTRTPSVFLVQFHPRIRAAVDSGRMRGLLRDAAGGRIGLTGVRELVMGVPNIEREIERWQALLEPLPPVDVGNWVFPDGPAIRLEPSPGFSQRLVCEVSSLDAAAAFLHQEKLLGNSTDDELQIAPAALAGLDIRLVQA
jgi:hypothetical protein